MHRRGFFSLFGAFAIASDDELADRMNRFANAYNVFATQNGRGIFDAKLARRLSQLWREIENCGEWPREGRA